LFSFFDQCEKESQELLALFFFKQKTAYEPMRRADGKLPSSWEVIYAHAWAPDPGAPIREGGHDVASVPVSAIPIRRKQS
ncbi:hypothetical protein, partial [Pseudoalteromonas sp. P1-9]|uniref:hypothetical protein n=1 Tax=Pseudoalteromonas sp. P1-9 TaxID=1710354 RepID=UPI000B058F0A